MQEVKKYHPITQLGIDLGNSLSTNDRTKKLGELQKKLFRYGMNILRRKGYDKNTASEITELAISDFFTKAYQGSKGKKGTDFFQQYGMGVRTIFKRKITDIENKRRTKPVATPFSNYNGDINEKPSNESSVESDFTASEDAEKLLNLDRTNMSVEQRQLFHLMRINGGNVDHTNDGALVFPERPSRKTFEDDPGKEVANQEAAIRMRTLRELRRLEGKIEGRTGLTLERIAGDNEYSGPDVVSKEYLREILGELETELDSFVRTKLGIELGSIFGVRVPSMEDLFPNSAEDSINGKDAKRVVLQLITDIENLKTNSV